MIESLTLENFQTHKHLHIDLDPRINSLTGISDAGKSSCIRALLWVMLNQLRGDYFIRHGEDFCRVTLRIDGHEIVREKSKNKNIYQLDGGSPYEAFGADVPEDIVKILGADRINFGLQFDSPYLLASTPGAVAKELNSIVNLDLIDSVLSYLASEQRKSKTSVQVCEERLENARKKKQELAWVRGADELLKDLEKTQEDLENRKSQTANLKSLIKELEEVEKTLSGAGAIIKETEILWEAGQALQEKMSKKKALESLVNEIIEMDGVIVVSIKKILALQMDLEEQLGGRCPVCGMGTVVV